MAASGRLTRPVLVILGATGAGKSKLAVEMSTLFNGEIISADSMQLYQGLDIVTNKPTMEELAWCRHHLVNFVSPLEKNYTVIEYSRTALSIIDTLQDKGKLPVIVGGTNYYVEALLWKFLLPSHQVEQQHGSGNTLAPCSHTTENKIHAVAPSGECKGKQNAGLVAPPSECNTTHNKVSPPDRNVGKHRRKKPEARGEGKDEDGDIASDGESRETKTMQYERLWEVDPETASRLHPSNVRKIARALEVFDQHGVPMSSLLADQHGEEGGGALSGPLRYPNPCVIWVQCQQQVLDERTDRRVDEMIDRGLVEELSEFHQCYNQQRLGDDRDADYTLGIFQTIGFKEFHDYLLLSAEEKDTARGRTLLQEGVDNMKRATRRYARRQAKWITSRFLKRRGANVPSVYAVDASSAALWRENVHEPSKAIINAYLQGEESPVDPLRQEENRNVPEYNVCEVCGGRIFTCLVDWQAHLRGRSHRNTVKKRKRELKQQQQILVTQLDTHLAQMQLQQQQQQQKQPQQQQEPVAATIGEESDVT